MQLKKAGKIGDETYVEAVATNMSYAFISLSAGGRLTTLRMAFQLNEYYIVVQ